MNESADKFGGNKKNKNSGMESLLSEFQSLQILTEELRQDIRRKEDDYRVEKAKCDTVIRDLNIKLSLEKDNSQRLSTELARRSTVEEVEALRRQLRAVQRIAFNVEYDEVCSFSSHYYYCCSNCMYNRRIVEPMRVQER